MKAYLGNEKYIFVSYSHADKDKVMPFIQALQKKYNVWYDEGLTFGDAYDDTIVKKISGCSLFMFLITKKSIVSDYCMNEIYFATDKCHKPFINVYLEDIKVSDSFDFKYGRYQYCFAFNYPDYDDAVDDIERKSDNIKEVKAGDGEYQRKLDLYHEIVRKNVKGTFDSLDTKEVMFMSAYRYSDIIGDEIKKLGFKIYSKYIDVLPTFFRFTYSLDKELSNEQVEEIANTFTEQDCIEVNTTIYKRESYVFFEVLNENFYSKDFISGFDEFITTIAGSSWFNRYPVALGVSGFDNHACLGLEQTNRVLLTGLGVNLEDHFILSCLLHMTFEEFKLAIIDYGETNVSNYRFVPHMMDKIAKDDKDSILLLNKVKDLIDIRKALFDKEGVKSIYDYNQLRLEDKPDLPKIPLVMIVISNFKKIIDSNEEIKSLVFDLLSIRDNYGVVFIMTNEETLPKTFEKEFLGKYCELHYTLKYHETLGEIYACKDDSDFCFPSGMALYLNGRFYLHFDPYVIRKESKETIIKNLKDNFSENNFY